MLGPLVKSNKAMKLEAWCLNHNTVCTLRPACRHTAGTPCTNFSRMGLQEGSDGITFVHILAWLGLRLQLQEAEIAQENVPDFPKSILQECLGHLYSMDSMQICPSQLGWPVQ